MKLVQVLSLFTVTLEYFCRVSLYQLHHEAGIALMSLLPWNLYRLVVKSGAVYMHQMLQAYGTNDIMQKDKWTL